MAAGSALGTSALARAAERYAQFEASPEADAAVAPRERLLFDFGWKFQMGNGSNPAQDLNFGNDQGDFAKTGDFKFSTAAFDDSSWKTVNQPSPKLASMRTTITLLPP